MDTDFQAQIERARDDGREHGEAAAVAAVHERTPTEVLRAIVAAADRGWGWDDDPMLPRIPDLSGEWADDPLPFVDVRDERDAFVADACTDAWMEACTDAFIAACRERAARELADRGLAVAADRTN